ncbi:glycoside hydrolase family 13 protein [Olivibacter sp. SDN3]|uniref:glycoside hydrolase family 13 protein n=1 Tax=Olivibacter sp. SDN3 TaxID=2764720 RepID=UPI001651A58F|nr:glycoside hydrolase family 13 protein [Olivibacter sp. SDN3]QNL49420.1 glycoside hydrolase family 13 protein [Olivibacter sp. SDN3]
MTKIKKLFAALYFLCAIHQLSGQELIKRVEPSNWWVGMYNPELQLIVYGNDISGAEIELDYPGVQVEKVHRVENANYLFLDLTIAKDTKPGTFDIMLQKNGKTLDSYTYKLKQRDTKLVKAQGINSSDFIYLLMPDRFANGDPKNDVVENMRENSLNRDSMYYRHGGDLQGVMDKLDYLQDLGVTAVWMTPVLTNDMEQASYHGYANTENYQIDPRLGSNDEYKRLGEELHKRQMKLVHDVVPNHVGLNHWTVLDKPMTDWVHQWDEYTNTTYKDQTIYDPYAAEADTKKMTDGWFVPSMPDMNQSNPFVQNYIIQSHIWWIEYAGIDGFRIDTYPYNDLDFMAKWSKSLNDEYPNFTCFGETWVHGVANQAYFTQGKTLGQPFDTHLQGVTDFQLQYAISDALNNKMDWTGGVNKLYTTLATDFVYQDPTRNVVFLDNHDMSRFFSVIGEDIDKYKSAMAWLLTTRGIPQIYYGAEILMKNFSDPDGKVRDDFSGGWPSDQKDKFSVEGRSEVENEMFSYLRKLANYRKNNAVLHTGKLIQFVPEEGVYVYFRYDNQKTVMIIMNTEDQQISLKTDRFSEMIKSHKKALDIMHNKTYDDITALSLLPKTTMILELQ